MTSPFGTVLAWDDHPWRYAWRGHPALHAPTVIFGVLCVAVGGISLLIDPSPDVRIDPRLDFKMLGLLAGGVFLIAMTRMYRGPGGSGVRGLVAHVRRGRRRGGLQLRRSLGFRLLTGLVLIAMAAGGGLMAFASEGWWNRAFGLGCIAIAPLVALGGGVTSRSVLELTPTDISISGVARFAWSDLVLFGPADQAMPSGYTTMHNALIAIKVRDPDAITWTNPFAKLVGRFGVPWDYDLVIAVRPFHCSPFLVLELIAFYGANPLARSELATDEALRRAEWLWSGLSRAGGAVRSGPP